MVGRDRRNAAADVESGAIPASVAMTTRRLTRSHSMTNLTEARSQGSGVEEAQVQNARSPNASVLSTPSSLPLNSALLAPDEDSFLFQPVPLGHKVQCKIIRRRQDGALYPQYEVYMEGNAGNRYFLLAARRKKKTRGATYLISLNRLDSGTFDEGVVAKVKSNFLGTLFKIYDAKDDRAERMEQAAVMYSPNIFGINGPRKLTLLLPGLTKEGRIRSIPCQKGKCQLHEQFRGDGIAKIIVMRNKSPQWNEETQSYVLNFQNRVSQASVKNFQVVPDFDIDYIVMQFGRIGLDAFTMDFQYPLSAIQAFGITLTSFDPKLACE